MSSTREAPAPARTPSLLRAGALAVVVAGALTAVTHLLFRAAGADMLVTAPGTTAPAEVPAVQAAVAAVTATVVGTVIAALLVRLVPRRAVVLLLVVAAAVFVAEGLFATTVAEQALTTVALEVEHVVVAGTFLALVLPVVRCAAAARAR